MSGRLRRLGIAPLVVCVTGLGAAGAARASDATLRATVQNDIPAITHTQARILNGQATYEKTHSSTALVRAVRAQDANLKGLQRRLSREAASSRAGRTGRGDVIKGLGLIVTSNERLTDELKRSSAGKPVSKAALKSIEAQARRGNLDLLRGAKLLRVRA